jgi:O-antigen/teichoic acid export membrane protein
MQKKLDYSLSLLPTFAANVVLIAIVLYAVYFGNFYLLMTAYVFSGVTNSFLTYLQIRNKYELKLQLKTFKDFSKVMLLTSWPLGIMLFLNLLYSRADVFILAFLKPTEDVGTYGISYRFFEIALALPTFLANSTYPVLLKVSEKKKEYLSLFMKYLKLYSILSAIIMMSIILFSPIIKILGDQFAKSIFPLQILSLSLPFFFATSLLQWHFLIKKKLFFLVPLYGSILIVNVILNLNFIPAYSYIAAAAITGVSEGLVFTVMLWYFYKSRLA